MTGLSFVVLVSDGAVVMMVVVEVLIVGTVGLVASSPLAPSVADGVIIAGVEVVVSGVIILGVGVVLSLGTMAGVEVPASGVITISGVEVALSGLGIIAGVEVLVTMVVVVVVVIIGATGATGSGTLTSEGTTAC